MRSLAIAGIRDNQDCKDNDDWLWISGQRGRQRHGTVRLVGRQCHVYTSIVAELDIGFQRPFIAASLDWHIIFYGRSHFIGCG